LHAYYIEFIYVEIHTHTHTHVIARRRKYGRIYGDDDGENKINSESAHKTES
jgi:diadenosine tetraphosphate (Ap4A) HIT family hydrolase